METGVVSQRCAIMAGVARIWCDEAYGAVEVLAVIPVGEGFHPNLCVVPSGKSPGWPVRAIFAGRALPVEKLARMTH